MGSLFFSKKEKAQWRAQEWENKVALLQMDLTEPREVLSTILFNKHSLKAKLSICFLCSNFFFYLTQASLENPLLEIFKKKWTSSIKDPALLELTTEVD